MVRAPTLPAPAPRIADRGLSRAGYRLAHGAQPRGRPEVVRRHAGFGFLVSEAVEGDILLHFSVLRRHGRRSLPEGALVECVATRLDRGLQCKKVLWIDLGEAVQPAANARSTPGGVDRKALDQRAGEFEPVEGEMVQSSEGLRLRQPGWTGRYGRVRAHGDGAQLRDPRPAARRAAGGADCRGPKGLTAVKLRVSSSSARWPRREWRVWRRAGLQRPVPKPVSSSSPAGLDQMPLTIRSSGRVRHFWSRSHAPAQEQAQGLMFRQSLADDRGARCSLRSAAAGELLDEEHLHPLDIIFISPDRTIARVAENTVPLSLDPVPSIDPCRRCSRSAAEWPRSLGSRAATRWSGSVSPILPGRGESSQALARCRCSADRRTRFARTRGEEELQLSPRKRHRRRRWRSSTEPSPGGTRAT